MKTLRFLLVPALVCFLFGGWAVSLDARALIGGRGIPVVSDPKDLNLVNMKGISDYLYADLKNKSDFSLIRRIAVDAKGRQYGIPNPRKSSLHIGYVISRGSSQNSSAILVAIGDFKYKNVRASLEKDYQEYMDRTKGTPSVSERTIHGISFTCFGYSERPYEVCIGQIKEKKAVISGAIPRGDDSCLEETLKVVLGETPLNESLPREIDAESTFSLTSRELERVVTFNRPKGNLRAKFAAGMKSLAQKLGIPHSDDETVPLEERIRGQLSKSEKISMKYHWDIDKNNESAYSVNYVCDMKDSESAEVLKNLVSEQIVRVSEITPHDGDKESIGKLTVSSNGNEVTLGLLLDTPEAQFKYLSLLSSQVFRYKSLMGYLDRYGQSAQK